MHVTRKFKQANKTKQREKHGIMMGIYKDSYKIFYDRLGNKKSVCWPPMFELTIVRLVISNNCGERGANLFPSKSFSLFPFLEAYLSF